jgi:large subunit ribosomal protein L18e
MKVKIKTDVSMRNLKHRVKRKSNTHLASIIREGMHSPSWKHLAIILSRGTRSYVSANLNQIDSLTKEGDTVIIPGKVLSSGDLSKKIRIVSLSISHSAKEKLKKTKSEYATIAEEMKINKKAEGVKILQ